LQEHHALGVDIDADIVELEHAVGGPGLRIELKEIAESRASAATNAQTQSSRDALALESFADLVYRFGSNRDHTTGSYLGVCLGVGSHVFRLLLVIVDGGLDSILSQHRAVNLHRRQAQFIDDVGVL